MKEKEIEERACACWMHMVPGLGRKTNFKLVRAAGSATEVFRMPKEQLEKLLTKRQYEHWEQQKKRYEPLQLLEKLQQRRIQYLYYEETAFPKRLYDIPDPPFGIFYAGQLPTNQERTLAMIGARQCSEYGNYMAEYFASTLAKYGVGIVSGMALGIDGISQSAALRAGGRSYGVLGCGLDVIYPSANTSLYYELCDKGGILTESVPGTEAKPGLFPQRNRIISALADVVLVVEAREKSGTLITVDMALEQGKEVYVIPGRCTDRLSSGCNRLLRQGATAAITPEDILEDMGWTTQNTGKKVEAIEQEETRCLQTPIASTILTAIDLEPMGADDILRKLRERNCRFTLPQIYQGLLELELQNLVHRNSGKYSIKMIKK